MDFTLEHDSTFSLTGILVERTKEKKKLRKRARTRSCLLAASAIEIEKHGYENLTIDHITNNAGLARGTFYLYYNSKSHVAITLFRMYTRLLKINWPKVDGTKDIETNILDINHYYVCTFKKNAALLAGREALLKESAEQNTFRDQLNDLWSEAVVRDVLQRKFRDRSAPNSDMLRLKVRCVIAMVDEILRELFIFKYSSLQEFSDHEEMIAQVITEIWFKALYD